MTPPVRNLNVPGAALVLWSTLVAWTPWNGAARAEGPLVSEFLAINGGSLTDEDGDHSDWIEIFNPSDAPVALEGWYLTDDRDRVTKWRFPQVDLGGGQFLIVFASGKDRSLSAQELHTNFRLGREGEYLALADSYGRVVHEYAPGYPPQEVDVSYGLAPGDTGEFRYFETPTPGEENGSPAARGFVDDTKFSVDRGFYTEPLEVEITTGTDGAQIRFTRDGTEPTAAHGEIYSAPIVVDRTTTLRAAAFKPDLIPTNVDTQTYIFVDDVVLQDEEATLEAGFPADWGETSPDYGLDPDVVGPAGRDRYGGKYAAAIREDLQAIPTLSIVMNIDDLFGPEGVYTHPTLRGVKWERPASVELIYPDGRPGFQENCGLRVQGGAFRSHRLTKKHSLRLLFKGIYGPTKLRFPWFGDGAADRFDTIVLRSNSNDGWQWEGAGSQPLYIRDSFARRTVLAMGGVAAHGSFVHLYLNGIYWGLYNPVERPDDSFSASYYGGDKDDWDAISNGALSSGSLDAWNAMAELARAGLADDASYQGIQGNDLEGRADPALEDYLDLDSLADYMIANLYVGNTDWPRKNYWVTRNRRAVSDDRPGSGGFKFHAWDTEWSLGIRSDLSTNRIDVSEGVAVAWPYLRQNAEFRVLFGDRVHRHFSAGGALFVDPARSEWDAAHPERNVPARRFMQLCDLVDRAVVAESARWGDQHRSTAYTRDEHWARERANLLANYFPYRSAVVLAQFREAGLYPRIEAPAFDSPSGTFLSSVELLMSAPEGSIFYTLDGTDPRLPGGEVSPRAIEIPARKRHLLIQAGAAARTLVPRDDSAGLDWIQPDYDDTGWRETRTPVGYERTSGYENVIATDIGGEMYPGSSSVYLRIPFFVDAWHGRVLRLAVKYDDGFIAYLNGLRVATANAPDLPAWNSVALVERSDFRALQFQEFDLSAYADLLRDGFNVLAIHGMSSGPTSPDLLFLPELVALEPGEPRETTLRETAVVKARARLDGEWSALSEATFVDTSLRVTEVMYHPHGPLQGEGAYEDDDYEFIEIENVGDHPVPLDGVRLSGAIRFEFSRGEVPQLAPGELLVVVKRLDAFESLYATSGLLIAGEYDGNLSNAGEQIRLEGPLGSTLLSFAYDDAWYPETDGGGYSLVIVDPRGDVDAWSEGSSWAASRSPGGSPGAREGEDPRLVGWQLVGDANQDGRLDVSDVVVLLRGLFGPGLTSPLPCPNEQADSGGNLTVLDWNGDRVVDLSDVVSLLSTMFTAASSTQPRGECIRIEGCTTVCAGAP